MLFQDEPAVNPIRDTVLDRVVRYLNYPFVDQNGFKVSILSLLLLVLIIIISAIISRYLRRFLQKRVLPKFHMGMGLQFTLLRLVHYVIVALGVLYSIKVGFSVDLTSIAVILGFLSVGIGFGLQYLASDIASGFILLFERPVRVGDWVSLSDKMEGRVEDISLRSTVVVTNENIAVIVPNSKLVQEKFVNYSYGSKNVRLNIPVTVANGSDLDHVSTALLEAAKSVEQVLDEPKSQVHFSGFGDAGLNLEIRVWINEPRSHTVIQSHVNFAIERAFKKYKIEIANPQLDLHFRSSAVRVVGDVGGANALELTREQDLR